MGCYCMFQNLIFDIGGVLFTWDPEKFVRIILGEQADITYFSDIIFKSKEWKELDRGSYSIEHLKNLYYKRYPLIKNEINLLLDNVIDLLEPINENIALLSKLKTNGYKLYIISNYVKEAIEEKMKAHDFFKLFEGMVISSYVKTVKPEEKIYKLLLEKYSLKAEECLFIDDSISNTTTAEKLDITSITYTSHQELINQLVKHKIKF